MLTLTRRQACHNWSKNIRLLPYHHVRRLKGSASGIKLLCHFDFGLPNVVSRPSKAERLLRTILAILYVWSFCQADSNNVPDQAMELLPADDNCLPLLCAGYGYWAMCLILKPRLIDSATTFGVAFWAKAQWKDLIGSARPASRNGDSFLVSIFDGYSQMKDLPFCLRSRTAFWGSYLDICLSENMRATMTFRNRRSAARRDKQVGKQHKGLYFLMPSLRYAGRERLLCQVTV